MARAELLRRVDRRRRIDHHHAEADQRQHRRRTAPRSCCGSAGRARHRRGDRRLAARGSSSAVALIGARRVAHRQRLHRGAEHAAAMLVVVEHVVGRAGRRQHDRVARLRQRGGARAPRRPAWRRARSASTPRERRVDLVGGLADQHDARGSDCASQRRAHRRVRAALVAPAGDQHERPRESRRARPRPSRRWCPWSRRSSGRRAARRRAACGAAAAGTRAAPRAPAS